MRTIILCTVAVVLTMSTCADAQQRLDGVPPSDRQVWPSQPPKDCPFATSTTLTGILFTGRHSDYRCGDTWYPSWASDGNLYSPWTDGTTEGVSSNSGGEGARDRASGDDRRRSAALDDQQHLAAATGQPAALRRPLPVRQSGV